MAYPHLAWPVTITTSTDDLVVSVAAVADTITLTAGTAWLWEGDDTADDLAKEFEDQLNTHSQLTANGGPIDAVFYVTLAQTGYLTVGLSGNDAAANVNLTWAAGGTNLDDGTFGFSGNASFGGATTYTTSPFTVSNAWFPNITEVDDRLQPVKIATHFEGVDAQGETAIYGEWSTRAIAWEWVTPCRVLQSHADDSDYATAEGITVLDPNIAFENLWDQLWNGDPVYYYPAGVGTAGAGPYYMWGTRPDIRDAVTVVSPGGTYYNVRVWIKG